MYEIWEAMFLMNPFLNIAKHKNLKFWRCFYELYNCTVALSRGPDRARISNATCITELRQFTPNRRNVCRKCEYCITM